MRRTPALITLAIAITALAAACSSGGGSEDTSTTASTTTTTEAEYVDLEAEAITFHPVEEIVLCEGNGLPGTTTETTDATTTTTSTVPAVDGELCYALGPAAGDGTDVRDAEVYADGVGIEVTVRADSVDALNELFDACYEATEACPPASSDKRGYVAIVIDGQVISTPAIDDEGLASSPFVITGDFDEAQATNIAAAINAT